MGEKSQTDQSLFWKSSVNQMQNLKTGKSLRKQTKLLAPATRQFTLNVVFLQHTTDPSESKQRVHNFLSFTLQNKVKSILVVIQTHTHMFKTLSCKEVEAQTRLTTTSPASPLNHTGLRCPVRHQTGHLTNNSWSQTTIVIIELYTFLVTWRWWIFWRICDLATRIFPRFKKFTYCAFNPHWLLVIFSFLLIGCCDFSGFGLTTFHRKQSKRDSYRLLLGNIHTDARGTKSSHFHVVNLAYTKNPCCLSAFIYSEKRLPVPGIQFVNRTAIVNGALVAGEQKTEQGLSFFHSLLLSRRLQSCSVLQTKLLEQATKTSKKQTR